MAEQRQDLLGNASPEFLKEVVDISEGLTRNGVDCRILRYFHGSLQDLQTCVQELFDSTNHVVMLILDSEGRCKYALVKQKE